MDAFIGGLAAKVRSCVAEAAAGLPGRDVREDDGLFASRLDGVVLGGYVLPWELEEEEPLACFQRQVEHVMGEMLRRLREKIDAATGEIVWVRRLSVSDCDGAILRLNSAGQWTFFFRAYALFPGVEMTLDERAPIPFVRAPAAPTAPSSPAPEPAAPTSADSTSETGAAASHPA